MRTSSIEPPWQPPPVVEQPIQPDIPASAVNAVAVPQIVEARIVDIDMPFWSMVNFMVKWALAFIPALIVLAVFIFFALAVLAALGYSITTP